MTPRYVACPGVVSQDGDGVEFDPVVKWHLAVHGDGQVVTVSIHDKEVALGLATHILNELLDKKDVVEVEVVGIVRPSVGYDADMFEQLTAEEAEAVHKRVQEIA